jgi:hypothetical protein
VVIISILAISIFAYLTINIDNIWGKVRQVVSLKQGETLRLEFERDNPRPVDSVSLVLKTIDKSDPFASYEVPLTIQIFEKIS